MISFLAAPAMRAPSALPSSKQFEFTSKINGKSYRVRVANPFTPPPYFGFE